MIPPKNKNISFYTHPLLCVFSSLLTLPYKRKFLSSCPLRYLQFCLNCFLYYNSLFPFIAIILSNEVSFYVTVDLFLFDDRSHQILCLFLIMYTLSLRFGAVCGNNENVRFIFVFSSCLNLPWSLTVPIPVSINFCFFKSLSMLFYLSVYQFSPFPSLTCLLEAKLLSSVCSREMSEKAEQVPSLSLAVCLLKSPA